MYWCYVLRYLLKYLYFHEHRVQTRVIQINILLFPLSLRLADNPVLVLVYQSLQHSSDSFSHRPGAYH